MTTALARARARTKRRPKAQQPTSKKRAPARTSTWGGARPGAGRKPGPNPKTPHRARPAELAAGRLRVTLRTTLIPLRGARILGAVRRAIAAADQQTPDRFRILEHSIEPDHVDLVVEATSAEALSSGMRSVAIRIARTVNDTLGRSGRLWDDRWRMATKAR